MLLYASEHFFSSRLWFAEPIVCKTTESNDKVVPQLSSLCLHHFMCYKVCSRDSISRRVDRNVISQICGTSKRDLLSFGLRAHVG